MSYLFCECSSLKELPNISQWNMENVGDISYMFCSCSSLISLPDISRWNPKSIQNLDSFFYNCSLLTFIPNISKWKFNKKIEINNIFKGCNSLLIIPDISKWNIKINEDLNFSSFISSQFSIKEIKSDSLISDNKKEYYLSEDSSSLEGNNNFNSFGNINLIDFSNNEEYDYYENFYN